MFLFPNNFESFGLDIGDHSLKAVYLKKKGNNHHVFGFSKINIPKDVLKRGEIKNEEAMVTAIKQLLTKVTPKKIPTPYVNACLPEVQTFIKLISVDNFKEEDEIESILIKELPNHIPIDPAESYLDWQVVSKNEKGRAEILVGAIPRVTADNYTKVLLKAGLKPVSLQIEAQAILKSLLKYKNESDEPMAIVDIGATRSSFISINQKNIQFTISLPFSGDKLTTQIKKQLELEWIEAEKAKAICGLDPNQCKGILLDIVKSSLQELVDSINQSLNYNKEHFSDSGEIKKIMLCGGGANLIGLVDHLSAKIAGIKFELGNPLINIGEKNNDLLDKSNIKISNPLTYTTAIGLALNTQ